MRIVVVLAGLSIAVGLTPAAEAACRGNGCAARAGRVVAPQHRFLPPARMHQRARRTPLRPYDGDQGGSFRPSFGCNVMGCD
jgi:hypothetical protein